MTIERDIFVTIVGAQGRMGAELLQNAPKVEGLLITDALVRPGSEDAGKLAGPTEVRLSDDLETAVANADVLIDFSTPESCLSAAQAAAQAGVPFVSGTTGLSGAQFDELRGFTSDIPLLWASNFSVGVNILARLVELASRASGRDFDIEILEAHHRHKVDAPSGTALTLGEAAARGRALSLDEHAIYSRRGQVGPREESEIGFQTLRAGDIVGEHTVFFGGSGERLELSHRATDRAIFALGALRAARWLIEQPAGWHTMQDVLFGDA